MRAPFMIRWACAVLVALTACQSPTVCVGVGVRGIDLHVVAAGSRNSLDTQAVVSVAYLEPPFDSLSGPLLGGPNGSPLALTTDRPGRLKLSVRVPGFRDYEQIVTVEKDFSKCGSVKVTKIVVEMIADQKQ